MDDLAQPLPLHKGVVLAKVRLSDAVPGMLQPLSQSIPFEFENKATSDNSMNSMQASRTSAPGPSSDSDPVNSSASVSACNAEWPQESNPRSYFSACSWAQRAQPT